MNKQCYCVNPVIILSMNMCGNCELAIDSSLSLNINLWSGYTYSNGKWVIE